MGDKKMGKYIAAVDIGGTFSDLSVLIRFQERSRM